MKTELECCFTGHREISPRHLNSMAKALDETVEKLIANGVTHFRAGGALGFDTVAALKILEKKRKYPFISLDLYLPCRDQAARWSEYDKDVYSFVLKNADSVTYTSEMYHRGCMLLRNRRMVDGTDFCVSYCRKISGGTAYTVNFAREKGISVINIAELCE